MRSRRGALACAAVLAALAVPALALAGDSSNGGWNGQTPPNCVKSMTPQVKVTVTGCVPYIFPILPSNLGKDCNGQKGFTVNRVAYFHDEGVRPN